jgi:hypothetical protein
VPSLAKAFAVAAPIPYGLLTPVIKATLFFSPVSIIIQCLPVVLLNGLAHPLPAPAFWGSQRYHQLPAMVYELYVFDTIYFVNLNCRAHLKGL